MSRIDTVYVGPQGQRITALDKYLADRRGHYTEQEKWLQGLGTEFVTVWIYANDDWFDERHVDDPETLETTVQMTIMRFAWAQAVYQRGDGMWVRQTWDHRKLPYPSREAAEMAVMHGGR